MYVYTSVNLTCKPMSLCARGGKREDRTEWTKALSVAGGNSGSYNSPESDGKKGVRRTAPRRASPRAVSSVGLHLLQEPLWDHLGCTFSMPGFLYVCNCEG